MSSINRIEDLAPIIVKEKDHPELYRRFFNNDDRWIERTFAGATEDVLTLMLENGLTAVPERRAVWSTSIFYQAQHHFGFVEKIGKSFPSEDFENNCRIFCQEKVARTTRHKNHICSHESRNPKNGEWGGSAELFFYFISQRGHHFQIFCSGACSGLKEWEDLALELGKYHFLGLISFDDEQVQEILRRADESTENDPSARPEGMTITEYVKYIFEAIDIKLGRKQI
ncbi:MAG: hypothetical protein WC022_00485 [Parcubacteria group bacterium]